MSRKEGVVLFQILVFVNPSFQEFLFIERKEYLAVLSGILQIEFMLLAGCFEFFFKIDDASNEGKLSSEVNCIFLIISDYN